MKSDNINLSPPSVTESVPLVPFKVVEAGIPFYTDQDCKNEVADARLLILQALDPDDDIQELDILPSTQSYQAGQFVTLGLEHKKIWDECWYRDPKSGEVTQAWKVHVNFIGEVISSTALEKEKDRIRDLEKRVEDKISQIRSGKKQPVN